MRPLLATLVLLSAATPIAAHASTLDDFVLTGNGHTYAFSLPGTGLVSGELQNGITSRVRYTQTTNFATVDGIASGGASGQFRVTSGPGNYGTVDFGIGSQNSGVFDTFYGPILVGYDPVSLSGYADGPYQAFFLTGSFDLFTRNHGNGQPTPYTLTITPEAANTSTPEPTTLALLATGSLGLFTTLRRRLMA